MEGKQRHHEQTRVYVMIQEKFKSLFMNSFLNPHGAYEPQDDDVHTVLYHKNLPKH